MLLNYFFALESLAGEQIRVGVGSKTSTNPAEKIAFMIGGDGAERVGSRGFLRALTMIDATSSMRVTFKGRWQTCGYCVGAASAHWE